MKFPSAPKDKPGTVAKAMDLALDTVKPELPHIFGIVKSLISFKKAYRHLDLPPGMRNIAEKIQKEIDKFGKDLYIHYNVDEGIIRGFDALIEKESTGE